MPDVGQALRGRILGIPNAVWLGAVAVGIWYFFLRGKGKAAGTANAAAAGSQLESGYGLGFAQGQQAAQAARPPPGGQNVTGRQTVTIRDRQSSGPYAQFDQTSPGVPVWAQPGSGQIGFVAYGSTQTLASNPSSGPQSSPGGLATNNRLGNPQPGPSNGFTTQYWGINYGPITGWVGANDVSGAGTGAAAGGPTPRKHAIGSRSANLMHDAHPLIGAPVKYAHYVRVGGPRTAHAHHANVNRVAQQAGVHPARVAMLNPVPTGLIRIA